MRSKILLSIAILAFVAGCANERHWILSKGTIGTSDESFLTKLPSLTEFPLEENFDHATRLKFNDIFLTVTVRNILEVTGAGYDRDVPEPTAITASLLADTKGNNLKNTNGVITLRNNQKIYPIKKQILGSTCGPGFTPRVIKAEISEISEIAIASKEEYPPRSQGNPEPIESPFATCLRFEYNEFIDPRQPFRLLIGSLSNSARSSTPVLIDFHPVLMRTTGR